MTRPRHPSPDVRLGIADIVGAMLRVLLAALLGGWRAPRDATALDGTMTPLLEATRAAAEDLFAEMVEWVAVPAPWRAGQGRFRTRFLLRVRPRGLWAEAWLVAFGRGPPGRDATNSGWITGMA